MSFSMSVKEWEHMRIEQLTEDNLWQAAHLFNDYRVFYDQLNDLEGAYEFLMDRLKRSDSVLFVANIDEEYAGFVQLYPTFSSIAMKRAYILNDLFVSDAFRKRGVAKQLMTYAFIYAEDQNARYITLETNVDNVNAQALYEQMGMEIDQSIKQYSFYLD